MENPNIQMENPLPQMENLLEKLKLLDYENGYVDLLRMRPINRHYFALPSNPGEQFFSMISLAAWLLRMTGTPFEQPEETDDPNCVTADIVRALRDADYDGECRADKMRHGSGAQVVRALSFLCDLALTRVKFAFGRPVIADENADVFETVGAEIFLEKVEEEMFHSDDDTNGEDSRHAVGRTTEPPKRLNQASVSADKFDLKAWRSEVERVAPALEAGYNVKTTDWRTNVDASAAIVAKASENLQLFQEMSGTMLARNSLVMDAIAIKETHVARRVEGLLTEHKALRGELRLVRTSHVNGVASRTATLCDLDERVDAVVREIDDRAAVMADCSRLVALRRAMASLGREVAEMDSRIAVLERCRTQELMRRKERVRRAMEDAAVLKPVND